MKSRSLSLAKASDFVTPCGGAQLAASGSNAGNTTGAVMPCDCARAGGELNIAAAITATHRAGLTNPRSSAPIRPLSPGRRRATAPTLLVIAASVHLTPQPA